MKYHVEFDIELKRNLYPGKFIAIEGIDGSGKTTQAHKIVEYFNESGVKSVFTKEPTDEMIGKLIKEILTGKLNFSAVAFQYLFAADRAVHQVQIEDYLKKGFMVVSDRYLWSSVVYGMVDKELSFERDNDCRVLMTAFSILSMYHQFLLPDYSFCLKADVKTAIRRIGEKDRILELYEKENTLNKLKDGYDWLAEKFNKEIIAIDGEGSVEEVTKQIVSSIKY
ncbi:MAG: dTMP kinase [Candidatus Levybacteria bacterium]|nr:dTMP kinase [Candidatus Levybacteria bacterium]MDZ4228084.1 dTMP kinase [Candidatus Levybacteria bacterium]